MNSLKKPLLFFVTFFFLNASFLIAQSSKFTVVIDPGHGGKDSGAIGALSKEKNISLAVAKELGALIKEKHPNVKVIFTRKTDVFVELNQRAVIANKAKANLFISLHCNALSKKRVSPQGVETFILGLHRSKDNLDVAKKENSVILLEDDYSRKYAGFNPSEPESYIIFEYMSNQYLKKSLYLASLVQHKLVKESKRVNRNVRQAGFLVLREVAMPSILIELGYITNRADEKFLLSKDGRRSMANSIYNAFKEYKREYDKKNQVQTLTQKNKKDSSDESTGHPAATKYRIQFLTASKVYPQHAPVFKGLSPVTSYKEGKRYKYTYGSTTDIKEALKMLRKVQEKFKDAFIVEFDKNGRIK